MKNRIREKGHNCRYFASQGCVTGYASAPVSEDYVKKAPAVADRDTPIFTLPPLDGLRAALAMAAMRPNPLTKAVRND
jgi:hypothetical protein